MLRNFFKDFSISRADVGLFLLVGMYVLAGYGVAHRYDALHFFNPVMYVSTGVEFTNALILGYVLCWALWAFAVMIFVRPADLKGHLWQNLRAGAFNKERYFSALPVFIASIFLLSTFTSLKIMIPYVHPFAWDTTLAALDHTIHGGQDAWALLHPVLGYPPVTFLINVVYNFWLLVLYLGLYWQLLSLKDKHTRMQFFYTLTLAWAVNGSLLAMIFSSGGPCYYLDVTGLDRFEPLMDYLRSIGNEDSPLWALVNQERLWEEYESNAHGIGAGISAMPSVHVSTALLFMLAGLRSTSKFWRIAGCAFFGFILIGSVHLGWHYAVDGYVAIVTTLALWFGAGALLRIIEKKP
ncbi:MAG: phosphatase PAP2 family protein [Rhodospirillales bacterium]|nr:phosphatase PAP2 family protein [Rhodospirillales bacterium]MCB9995806.1 phosphatase PAP2 family protein [Rhodospirillales bacterium]